MSLYDDAAVALIAEGAAGKDGVLYNIKPEEKLKPTELLANGGFDSTDDWVILAAYTTVSITDGKLVFDDSAGNAFHRAKSDAAVFEIGKTYKVSFNVSDFSRSGSSVKIGALEDDRAAFIEIDGDGNYSKTFTAVGYDHGSGLADTELVFKVFGNVSETVSCKIDNVSVKEVEQAPLDFTFTRGSNLTATRVAPSGYIEKGRENLIKHSNAFDVGTGSNGWAKTVDGTHTSDITVTSGVTGYDGSSNAWKFQNTGSHERDVYVRHDVSASGVLTYSVYAKAGSGSDGSNWVRLNALFASPSSVNSNSFFDLSGDGALGAASGNLIDRKIEKIGSQGWFRISITFDETIQSVRLTIAEADQDADVPVNTFVYFQSAQLEAGLVATDYIESGITTGEAGILEDSPRFDYTGGGCPHLLMEPTRINLVPYSEYFGAWNAGNVTVTDNDVKSPEGVVNAAKILASDDTSAVNHQVDTTDFSIVSGPVTASVFAKKGNVDFVRLRLNATTAQTRAWFDLENGTVETVDDTDPDAFGTIVDMGDGWYRCSVTEPNNTAAQSAAELQVFINESDNQTSWIGDGDEYIYVYGAQYEQGAYATSYIPNHGTSAGVTRNEDDTNTIDLSDYMDGEDITLFVDLADNPLLIRDGSTSGIKLSNGTSDASSIRFYRSYENVANGGLRTMVYFANNENDGEDINVHQITESGRVKVAVRRVKSTGEFTIFYDGAQKSQDFSDKFENFDSLRIDGRNQPLFINSVIIFDRALTDDECTSLTTV